MRVSVENRLQQIRRPEIIHGGIVGNFVHGLPDSNRRSQVKDHIRVPNYLAQLFEIANVPLDELDFRAQVSRESMWVDLWTEVVEHAYLMALPDEGIRRVGADKAGTPGDQNLFRRHFQVAPSQRLLNFYFSSHSLTRVAQNRVDPAMLLAKPTTPITLANL